MFVVRRPFRDASGMVAAGSVIEPADIKRFKRRMFDGHIVTVTEHNYDMYASFFKQKYGVDLPAIEPAASTEPTATAEEPKAEAKADAKSTEVKKVVVTAK